ncbi:MAG: hypothetical protein GX638_02175 [Crenarchaeota archaeon]|nr:hypothetical protein [Thermoproteota archaeon]
MAKYTQTKERVKNRLKLTDKQFDSLYTQLPDSAKRKLNSDDIADLVTFTFKIKEKTKRIVFKQVMKVSGNGKVHKKLGRPKGSKNKPKKELTEQASK